MKCIRRLILGFVAVFLGLCGISLGNIEGASAVDIDIHISTSNVWPTYTATVSLTADRTWTCYDLDKAATITAHVEGVAASSVVSWDWSSTASIYGLLPYNDYAVFCPIASSSYTATISLSITYLANSVDQTYGTASASIDIDVLASPEDLDELVGYGLVYEGQTVAAAGYVVSEDSGGYRLASNGIGHSPDGSNSVRLSGSPFGETQLSLGQYAYIRGTVSFSNLRATEFVSGYEVLETEYSLDLLVSFINGSDADSQCEFKFEIAKAHYIGMSETDRNAFKDHTGDDATGAAKARYEAWALYLGEEAYPEDASEAIFGFIGSSDRAAYAIAGATIMLVVGVVGIGVYLTFKKRKQA